MYNKHLINIKRKRVSEGRNLIKGLRLDRNEKVDLWPETFVNNVLKNKPKSFLALTQKFLTYIKKLQNLIKLMMIRF